MLIFPFHPAFQPQLQGGAPRTRHHGSRRLDEGLLLKFASWGVDLVWICLLKAPGVSSDAVQQAAVY